MELSAVAGAPLCDAKHCPIEVVRKYSMTAVAGSSNPQASTGSPPIDGSQGAAPQQSTPQQAVPQSGAPPQSTPKVASLPTLTLPKAGGAIRGIGEKFSTNPANGTGS